MLSPTELNNLHSTEAILPHVLLSFPTVLKVSLHSTDVIPLHVLMLSPTVLNNLHSNEDPTVLKLSPTVLKLSPTVLMLSPDVLNNLQCTKQPSQY